jgi:hypothetical protein
MTALPILALEYVEPELPDALYKQRWQASCDLASHLLYPEFVYDTVLYWLVNFTNYTETENEEQMFNDIVAQLLRAPPLLKQHSGEGMYHRSTNTFVYPSYMALWGGGSDKLAVPMEYYEQRHYFTQFDALSKLTHPVYKAFNQRVPVGLGGELQLGQFTYNQVLEYFSEPGFLITTCYMLHLVLLTQGTGGYELVDWLPRHYHSLKALEEGRLSDIRCLGDPQRLAALKVELRALYDVLHTPDLTKALEDVRALWERKASYCWSEIFVRLAAMFGNLSK